MEELPLVENYPINFNENELKKFRDRGGIIDNILVDATVGVEIGIGWGWDFLWLI